MSTEDEYDSLTTYICVYMYMCVNTSTYMHMCIYVYRYSHTYILFMHICTYAHTYAYACTGGALVFGRMCTERGVWIFMAIPSKEKKYAYIYIYI